ncbi:hypothetical protein RRG08_011417 [Elysia crispata]|uniref:Uncharacterized protein n=1 Tax=Elysia crispata TaxID=231223 RepID=A0AAE1DXX7_9GAST|nr:hypothetical protein RRG08_011417 [Elysia crispata]
MKLFQTIIILYFKEETPKDNEGRRSNFFRANHFNSFVQAMIGSNHEQVSSANTGVGMQEDCVPWLVRPGLSVSRRLCLYPNTRSWSLTLGLTQISRFGLKGGIAHLL